MSEFRSSRHHRQIVLADWRDAEELASWFMREKLGMRGARITGSGNDGGIDVVADGAVAQVKHVSSPVGAPFVQAALGAGHGRDEVLFFALSGYTRQAIEFAARAGVCLFRYDIYGDVRAQNQPARELVANVKDAGTMTIQDVRMNELRAKAAPALSELAEARDRAEALARTLEGITGLGSDNQTLALILAEYAAFFAEPGRDHAIGSYDRSVKTLEAARAGTPHERRYQSTVYSKDAVEAGLKDLIALHEELEDVGRLRKMSAAQWVRNFSDWHIRRSRIKYLTQYSTYGLMEDKPPLEALELRAAMDSRSGLKNTIATRWPSQRPVVDSKDVAICFAAAQKDPINFGTHYCLGLFENLLRMGFDDEEEELPPPAYPLGWSSEQIDRLRGLIA